MLTNAHACRIRTSALVATYFSRDADLFPPVHARTRRGGLGGYKKVMILPSRERRGAPRVVLAFPA